MIGRIHSRLSYANVTATIALVLALGGTAYAAVKITGAEVKNGSLSGEDVANQSLSGADVQNLSDADFKGGRLLAADGTTERVQVNGTIDPDGTGGQVATCPSRMVATGGGFVAANTDGYVRDSLPAGDDAWAAFVEQGMPGTQFTVWAICSS